MGRRRGRRTRPCGTRARATSRRRCSATSSARNTSCELPVASMHVGLAARRRSRLGARVAASAAAARASSGRPSKTRTAARRRESRLMRTAAARARSRRASRRSSARRWSKSMRPASGSSSIASTTAVAVARRSRPRPSSPATRRPGAATRRAAAARCAWSRPREAVAVRDAHRLDHRTSAARSGHWPGVREVEREGARLVAQEASRSSARPSRPTAWSAPRSSSRSFANSAWKWSTHCLAFGDRREPDAPALAPLRLLGEEAGEELDEVAVARAGQHAEALEQRELHPVARRRSRS